MVSFFFFFSNLVLICRKGRNSEVVCESSVKLFEVFFHDNFLAFDYTRLFHDRWLLVRQHCVINLFFQTLNFQENFLFIVDIIAPLATGWAGEFPLELKFALIILPSLEFCESWEQVIIAARMWAHLLSFSLRENFSSERNAEMTYEKSLIRKTSYKVWTLWDCKHV